MMISETAYKKVRTSTSRKVVRFNSRVRCRPIIAKTNLAEHVKATLWFTVSEVDAHRRRRYKARCARAQAESCSSPDETGNEEFLGFQDLSYEDKRRSRERARNSISLVLLEQKLQDYQKQGPDVLLRDPTTLIALAYSESAEEATREANIRGLQQEKCVQELWARDDPVVVTPLLATLQKELGDFRRHQASRFEKPAVSRNSYFLSSSQRGY